jgi:branched-chain amino acid aminotransferase
VVPAEQARIAAIDHGLTIGHGVFETCKIANGVVFALGRHLRRLARSAAILRLDCPAPDRLRVAVDELLAATTPLPLGRLRIAVTAGSGLLTLSGGHCPAHRRHDRGPAASRPDRTPAGCSAKGTTSNVVIEREGVLVTPPLSSGCLPGITRELFLEWAVAEGLPVLGDDVTLDALAAVPEVLLTSSVRDVQHVSEVDGRSVPGTALGSAARELFVRRAAADVDP